LNKILKYLYKFFKNKLLKNFDISPIEGGGIPKAFIYVIWGLNSVIFLGEDIIQDHFTEDSSYQTVSSSSSCTILKKVKSDADLTENIEIVNSNEFTIVSSYSCELVKYDVVLNHSSRGPPLKMLCIESKTIIKLI